MPSGEGEELTRHKVAGMRRHNVEKAGFCFRVAESLESFEMGRGDVHSVRIPAVISRSSRTVKGGVKLDHWGGGKLDQMSVWKMWINREGGVWSGGLRSGLRTAFRPERKTPPSAREVGVI